MKRTWLLLAALLLATQGDAGLAQDAPARAPAAPAVSAPSAPSASIQQPEILLWPAGAPGALGDSASDRPTVTPFLPAPGRATGAAAVVFPGGGYSHIATEKEGVTTARWLNTLGVAAFVVRYRLGPRYHHPVMLQDAARAVRLVRSRAAEWGLAPDRIGVVGFSAGGHLASSIGTHYDAGAAGSADPIERVSSRPDFMVLIYPVITMDERWTHRGSRDRLLGDSTTPALVRLLSNETQVTPATPPAFLVATTDDGTVPVPNSLFMYQALYAAGVPVEMHIFESGRHGFGLAPGDPVLSAWTSLCEAWLRRHGWVARPAPPAPPAPPAQAPPAPPGQTRP